MQGQGSEVEKVEEEKTLCGGFERDKGRVGLPKTKWKR